MATDPDAECSDAMIEADGNLCTVPQSTTYVAAAPNGSLLILGSAMPRGHDPGKGSYWVWPITVFEGRAGTQRDGHRLT